MSNSQSANSQLPTPNFQDPTPKKSHFSQFCFLFLWELGVGTLGVDVVQRPAEDRLDGRVRIDLAPGDPRQRVLEFSFGEHLPLHMFEEARREQLANPPFRAGPTTAAL